MLEILIKIDGVLDMNNDAGLNLTPMPSPQGVVLVAGDALDTETRLPELFDALIDAHVLPPTLRSEK